MSKVKLAVVLLIVVVAVAVRMGRHGDGAAPASVAVATQAPVSPTTPSASPSTPASPTPSAPASGSRTAGATTVAETWVQAWLDTSVGRKAWLARLRPITDGTLWDALAIPGVVDSVPRGTAMPGAKAVATQDGSTIVRVPTTAGPMLVTLSRGDGGKWVAISNDRAPRGSA